jgi:low affinity Fe/Cu permease
MTTAGHPAGLTWMERVSARVTRWTGSTQAIASAGLLVVGWIVVGPVFHFSNTWQLVINTFTTIVTFLMVFLIQRTQNKDSTAVALKLNELIAALKGASNRLIAAEHLSEAELELLSRHYEELVDLARKDRSLTQSHSVEEAGYRHQRKSAKQRRGPATTDLRQHLPGSGRALRRRDPRDPASPSKERRVRP